MAKLSELLSNIEILLTNNPTDESAFNLPQAKFALDYCTAYMMRKRYLENLQIRRSMPGIKDFDPLLYKTHKLKVNEEGKLRTIELPTSPISIIGMDNFGILSVYAETPDGCISELRAGTLGEGELQCKIPYGDVLYARVGNTLRLFNSGTVKQLNVVMAGFPLEDLQASSDNPDTCLEVEYPCPPDLIAEVTEMVVKILLGTYALPQDTLDDNKQEEVNK